jgi:hypothetical protein
MLANHVKKFAITSWLSRSRLNATRFQRAGQLRPLTSLIKWYRENRRTDWASTVRMRSKITPGWKIFRGTICGTAKFRHHLFHRKRTTLTKRILMRTGRTRRMRNSSKICSVCEETRYSLSSMAITLTFNWLHWVRTRHLSIRISSRKRHIHRKAQPSRFLRSVCNSPSRKKYPPKIQRSS